MIKGVLFDIDDTLYSHTINSVPEKSKLAIKKLKEKGIKIGICTSREPKEIIDLPSDFWDDIDCRIYATGSVTYIKDKYLKCYTIEKSIIEKVIKYCEERNISYLYSNNICDLYYYGEKDRILNLPLYKHVGKNIYYKKWDDDEVVEIGVFANDSQTFEELRKLDENISVSLLGITIRVLPKFVDKSFGLLKFCEMYSVSTDEVIACGDGLNDDLMLKMAGIGIAVKNAKENTKKAADYICEESIEDGGLYTAFIELKVIE